MPHTLFSPSQVEINRFVDQSSASAKDFYLWGLDPARVISLMALKRTLGGHALPVRHKVAVVSGSLSEPELAIVPLSTTAQVDDLKYPENQLFDLEKDWSQSTHGDFLGKYDTVICAQVLEHMSNPSHGFRQLVKLLAPGGLLILNLPALNGNHGDPDYWFAGFHPRWLERQAIEQGLTILDVGGWGSCRSAISYALCDWAPWGVIGPLRRSHLNHPKRLMAWLRHRIKYGPILSSMSALAQPKAGLDRQFTISWLIAIAP
jgi:SAM-dependent methyltransferase